MVWRVSTQQRHLRQPVQARAGLIPGDLAVLRAKPAPWALIRARPSPAPVVPQPGFFPVAGPVFRPATGGALRHKT
ncbi:MAG: hypothetical protein AMJ66_11740 [Betaproteobacteria bacterium SG8_40]|nr:MAG: hypothetical protein AMJ66_11740 [Betaproteobacteria bacterium SG8_40]